MASVNICKHQLAVFLFLLNISSTLSAIDLDKWINTIDISFTQKAAVADEKQSNSIELVFIYSSSCSYCKKFAPIFKNFVSNNKLKYLSITIDGGLLPGFEDAKYLPDVAKALNVSMYPTVLAINPINKNMMTLSQGYTSFEELMNNYLNATDYLARSNRL